MYKVLCHFGRFGHKVIKLRSFESSMSDIIPANVQNISHWFSLHLFDNFIEKKASCKVLWCFSPFSWTYKVMKFQMIKLYLDISNTIHTNEHTKHANSGSHVNFLTISKRKWTKLFILHQSYIFSIHNTQPYTTHAQ